MAAGDTNNRFRRATSRILKEQLAQIQKLTALGELVSTTTHEFNNVLTTIINYAKMGMRHHDNATREKAFEKILRPAIGRPRSPQRHLGLARNRTAGQEPTDLPSWSTTRCCCWSAR